MPKVVGYQGPSLASPFPLWSLHACPSLVPLSICDWVRAGQLPGWSQCPTGVQLRRVIADMLLGASLTHAFFDAAHAWLQGTLQHLVTQGKRALQDYSLTPRRPWVVSSGPQRSEKFPSGKVLYQYPRAVYRDTKCDYAYIYPTGDSLDCASPTTATPQPLVRKWLVQADDFHRNPQRVSQRDWPFRFGLLRISKSR